ncbi:hypothetical protein ACIA8O_01355 [Kitasatospora sp. NPDC051853]|uniref:hypothetical protein n=1 Tax=Kitasatospora sp. NPDC051853 TaxID=3364058 RepID=UPI0037AD2FD4
MPHHVTPGDVLRWAVRALAALGSVWYFTPLPPPWPPTDQYPAGPPLGAPGPFEPGSRTVQQPVRHRTTHPTTPAPEGEPS